MTDEPTNAPVDLPPGDPLNPPPAATTLPPGDPLASPLPPGDPLAPKELDDVGGKRRRSKKRFIPLAVILTLSLTGAIVRSFREANADPSDIAACNATMPMVETPSGQTVVAAIDAWRGAKDSSISSQAPAFVSAAQANQGAQVDAVLNKVIHRCQSISPDFRDKFHQHCVAHPDQCTHKLNLSPF